MTDQRAGRVPRPGLVGAILAGLGLAQLTIGAYALFAPRSFYEDFPLGRGWVEALPAYSEHLARDVGGLFLMSAVVLLAAAVVLERRLVLIASLGFLAFSVPHTVFHLFNLEPYGTGDVIGNVVALSATVLGPLAVLWIIAGGVDRPARSAAAGSNGNGRVAGVPETSRNPVVRAAYRSSRKREGAVLDPIRIFAHHPTLLAGYGALELATERARRVPPRLKHLAEMRAAMLTGCEWCLDYGSAISTAQQVPEEDLRDLPAYSRSDRFSELEKLVLDYATGISSTPVEVSDELFERLRAHLDEAQLVELTSVIALENYRGRFNWAFGIAGQGFAEGAYCVRPATAPTGADGGLG